MWVFEEHVNGKPLTQIINQTHVNVKYLPGIDLGENVYAEPDLSTALKDATALVVVLPHQFLRKTLEQMKNTLNGRQGGIRAVTLIKGVDVQGTNIQSFAKVIENELGVPCSALSGANIANEGMSRLLLFDFEPNSLQFPHSACAPTLVRNSCPRPLL
jgi:glycerol-3-phosphate dehydrogenase (NAD+)